MPNWLNKFMYGRYGFDNLSRFMMILWFAIAFINLFFKSYILYAVTLIPAFLILFRMLSRNIIKRRAENARYQAIANKTGAWFSFRRQKLREIKTHRYRKCPHCSAVLRLPRKTGVHTALCPRCKNRFEVKIVL